MQKVWENMGRLERNKIKCRCQCRNLNIHREDCSLYEDLSKPNKNSYFYEQLLNDMIMSKVNDIVPYHFLIINSKFSVQCIEKAHGESLDMKDVPTYILNVFIKVVQEIKEKHRIELKLVNRFD